ncbi:hypothetical protein [Weissella cibaria]|nr:hypothetical protein [Weissella cibaria]
MDLSALESEVDYLIKSANIYVYHDEYESSDPDVVVIREDKSAVIIINDNFLVSVPIVVRKAHEYIHAINNNDTPAVYNFSTGMRDAHEISANTGMIQLLAFLSYSDTPLEYRNYLEFMRELNLPSWFEDMAREAVMTA